MSEFTHIYGLVDPRNECIRYVGKANDPRARLRKHFAEMRRCKPCHRTMWLSNLVSNGLRPIVVILDRVPMSEWEYWERYYIAHLRRVFDLTNGTDGGEGGMRSEEHRKKIGDAHRGMKRPPFTDEHRRKLSEAAKVRGISKETRAKMTKSLLGREVSLETRAKIGAANRGHKHTEETKLKMRGRIRSEEHKRKLGDARRGKPMNETVRQKFREFNIREKTDEHRAKIANSIREHWRKKKSGEL